MIKEIQLAVSPQTSCIKDLLLHEIAAATNTPANEITTFQILKKSIDARQRNIKINLKIKVFIGETPPLEVFIPKYQNVSGKEEVIVIGSGPAGLFAALKLIERGLKPIVLERGKDVSSRKKILL